jgi:hypothetical protein
MQTEELQTMEETMSPRTKRIAQVKGVELVNLYKFITKNARYKRCTKNDEDLAKDAAKYLNRPISKFTIMHHRKELKLKPAHVRNGEVRGKKGKVVGSVKKTYNIGTKQLLIATVEIRNLLRGIAAKMHVKLED